MDGRGGLTLSGSLHESCAAVQRRASFGRSAGYSSRMCYSRAQLAILTWSECLFCCDGRGGGRCIGGRESEKSSG
jgi:hypothetical protein